jgi:uncharacterized membrane protein AbrB (regulator of aidB expression)
MDKNKKYWLDQSKNVNKIVYLLYVACAALLIVDLFYHKHGHFTFEHWFGFYAWFGFIACVIVVLSAKVLRILVKRKESYYD